jgi:hypothetical protein
VPPSRQAVQFNLGSPFGQKLVLVNTNPYDSFDVHLSRKFMIGEHRCIEVIAQVFNLFGHENLLGVAAGNGGYVTNAASPTGFGTIGAASNQQQAALAARFVS